MVSDCVVFLSTVVAFFRSFSDFGVIIGQSFGSLLFEFAELESSKVFVFLRHEMVVYISDKHLLCVVAFLNRWIEKRVIDIDQILAAVNQQSVLFNLRVCNTKKAKLPFDFLLLVLPSHLSVVAVCLLHERFDR